MFRDRPRSVWNRSLLLAGAGLNRRGAVDRSVADLSSTAIEQYKSLREEILLRVRLQGQLINLNFTGIAAVSGVAFSYRNSTLFLVVPVLSAVLGLGWLDHLRMVAMLGEFIRRDLWQHVQDMSPAHTVLPGWDEAFSRANTFLAKQITGSVPPIVAFIIPPFVAIGIAYRPAMAEGLSVLWYLDAGLCFVLTVIAIWVSFAEVLPEFTSDRQ